MFPSFVSVTFKESKSILMQQKNLAWELITLIWFFFGSSAYLTIIYDLYW